MYRMIRIWKATLFFITTFFITIKKSNSFHTTSPAFKKSSRLQFNALSSFQQNDISQPLEKSPSTLHFLTFHNVTKSTNPVQLSEFLMEIGATSTTITDHDRDTPNETPLFDEPNADIDKEKPAMEIDSLAAGKNVWMRCDVSAHLPSSFDLVGIVKLVEETLEVGPLEYTVDDVDDRDWVTHVQESWNPIMVDGFVLRFPWHDDGDVRDVVGDNDCIELELEGGVAFGTGEHATTQLCLGWVRDNVMEKNNVEMLLDYGAGSGVLGIAACKCQKGLHAVGVDIDVDAVKIADQNAKVNSVHMNNYLPNIWAGGNGEEDSVFMKGLARTTEVEILPDNLSGRIYDACVANILAQPLIGLTGTIASFVKPCGALGLSGILADQAEQVIESYSDFFDDVKVKKEKDGWVLITGTRKN